MGEGIEMRPAVQCRDAAPGSPPPEEDPIAFESVIKRFGAKVAVRDVTFSVRRGELLALIGRSGCGKTTTLRLANGLERPDSGRIRVERQPLASADLLSLRRRVGYVVQDGGLFPHLDVLDNVSILGIVDRQPRAGRRRVVEGLLEMLQLPFAEFAGRYPGQLSGGERQRVSIARALYLDPPIVLMDEPFGALDPITRKDMHREFRALKARFDKTILFVTHDVPEAFALADRVAIMERGAILQLDTPDGLLTNPSDDHVRRYIRGHLGPESGGGEP